MNEHQIISRLMELQPLTDDELRQIGIACPTEENRRLLWEIKRLQRQIISLHITCVSHVSGSLAALSAFESNAQLLMKEPAVQAYWREKHPELEREDLRKWSFALSSPHRVDDKYMGNRREQYGGERVQPLPDDQESGKA